MKYVLDTNTLSFAMAGEPSVCERLLSHTRTDVRLEDFDVAVAAHALSLGATLVTDNVDHMSRIPNLQVENWRLR